MYKLILIDDEELFLDYLYRIFNWEDMGFSIVRTFSDSRNAVQFLENNTVDLIISDIKMPHLDGIELSKICYKNYPSTQVILMSAYRDFEYARSAIKYGVTDYMTKPIDYDEFVKCINNIYEQLEDSRSNSSPINTEIIKQQQIFCDLMFGVIRDPQELITQLLSIGIDNTHRNNPCALITIHIHDFYHYIENTWKYDIERLYYGIAQLVPFQTDLFYCSLIRYSYDNMEWIIINKKPEESTAKIITDFEKSMLANLKSIFNITADFILSDMYNSLLELIKHRPQMPIDSKKENEMSSVLNYMKENFDKNITLDDVAKIACMSPIYFSNYFKKKTGKKFIDTLTEMRMEKAAALLKNSNIKINGIYSMLGYKNASHFYNSFKNYYNITPADYRNLYTKDYLEKVRL